jgi:cation diffusion facilitator CzcD-associated flavoprotein CzcO
VTQDPDAIIVGAGPAGLACAATMRGAGLDVAVLEKADRVGAVWRRHYDRLHLHTDRRHSGLPGMAMPRDFPAYPSRAQMVDYLESYAAPFRDQADLRHGGLAHCTRGPALARRTRTGHDDCTYRGHRDRHCGRAIRSVLAGYEELFWQHHS